MSSQGIKFGEKEVVKKDFYSSKCGILLNDVDMSKIVVSNKWKINETICKFFIGYMIEDLIKPLCIVLPQMSGFIKYFEDNIKNMPFITDDTNVYTNIQKYGIELKNLKLKKLKFTTNPICDGKYVPTKLKIFNGVNKTMFSDDQIPMEKNHYVCIAPIDIDLVLKVDEKVYLQVYLEQCKYKLKKEDL